MTDKLQEVAFDALREMYRKAEPSLDFDHAFENPEEYDEDWYRNHYLDSERQREIVNKHCEENNLSGRERQQVVITAILYWGPSGSK